MRHLFLNNLVSSSYLLSNKTLSKKKKKNTSSPTLRCTSIDSSYIQVSPLAAQQSLLQKTYGSPILRQLTSQARAASKSRHFMSHTTCTAPRKSGPCSGPYFTFAGYASYICSFDPLSCVPLSSFRSRPPALHANFPSAIERRRILIDPAPAVSC